MNHRKTFTAGVIAPLLLAALALAGCQKDPKEHRVAVLFTTDEHSHVFAFAPELDDWPLGFTPGTGTLQGGVARRTKLIERAAGRPCGTPWSSRQATPPRARWPPSPSRRPTTTCSS